jgi:phosphopantetheinyl transferase
MPRFLSLHELKLIQSMPPQDQVRYATLFWSIKESAFKAYGESGIDFNRDILIHSRGGNESSDFVVEFRNTPSIYHPVYCKDLGDVWLTALYLKM